MPSNHKKPSTFEDELESLRGKIEDFNRKHPNVFKGDLPVLLEDISYGLEQLEQLHDDSIRHLEREVANLSDDIHGMGRPVAIEIGEALEDLVDDRRSKLAQQIKAFANQLRCNYPKFRARDLLLYARSTVPSP